MGPQSLAKTGHPIYVIFVIGQPLIRVSPSSLRWCYYRYEQVHSQTWGTFLSSIQSERSLVAVMK